MRVREVKRREGGEKEEKEEKEESGRIIKRDINEWKQEEVTYFKMSSIFVSSKYNIGKCDRIPLLTRAIYCKM